MTSESKSRRRRQISYPMFRFENPGDTLIGKIIERAQREFDGRVWGRYVLLDENGERWTVFGTAQLDDAFSRSDDESVLEIVYTGVEESASGFPVKQFDVWELEG